MFSTQFKPKFIFAFALTFILVTQVDAQTKKLKRPKTPVGISSVDNFVRESFDLYDKVYIYDSYVESGLPLKEGAIILLEDALYDLTILSESAPNILSDIDGAGVIKQGRATLQLNRAKKALNYSIKTAKKLILNNKKEEDESPDDESGSTTKGNDGDSGSQDSSSGGESGDSSDQEAEDSNVSDKLEVYSKFDFVPGDELLYFDDFSQDFIGDFPSKWNTNGSGEVVRTNKAEGNWFEVKPGYKIYYIPLLDGPLPEEYTIEFDILVSGIDKKTSSTAMLSIYLDDNDGFNLGRDMAQAEIPFCQYSPIGITMQNKINGSRVIYSRVTADIRKDILNQPHVSIAVNKKRFRLWVNQEKYIDVPQLVPENKLKYIKLGLYSLKDGKEHVFIRNIKVAKGGVDLRSQLINEGKVSTNGILFDSGSANIQPQSYGIIRQISQVLMQDESINLNIIGHTDSDGNNDSNLKLSKARSEAVKQALITVYKISGDRLQADGKGESEPVGDNSTSEGKAQNRRVVFIKI